MHSRKAQQVKRFGRAEGILKPHPWPCTTLYSSRQTLDLRIHLLYNIHAGSEHFGHIRRPGREVSIAASVIRREVLSESDEGGPASREPNVSRTSALCYAAGSCLAINNVFIFHFRTQ